MLSMLRVSIPSADMLKLCPAADAGSVIVSVSLLLPV